MNDGLFQGLFESARSGRSDGYINLAGRAVASGNAGELARSASLAHAMVWTRLAVAVDASPSHLMYLAEVLASYALDVGQRGFAEHSIQIGAQAIYRFEQAASHGHEGAATQLGVAADALPLGASQLAAEWQRDGHSENIVDEDACLRAAACGDPASLGDLFDIALDGASAGGISSDDVAAMLDVIGALGKATNDTRLVVRYAGVLLMRSAHLRSQQGSGGGHWRADAEAISILIDLFAKGEPDVLDHLKAAVRLADQRALAAVAQDQPAMLAALDCKGTC